METAAALVLEAPRALRLEQLPLPEPAPDCALLRVEACGLCGTDHEQYTGAMPAGFAFVPGHETVGRIEWVGPEAARRWGVNQGDRVAVEVFQSCRDCAQCVAGNTRHCVKHGVRDMYGFIPRDRAPGLWGGYAEYQYLAPDTVLQPIPGSLDSVLATLFNPLGAGIRWAWTLPGTKEGDVVCILGPGIRGICSAVAAREAGAGFVMVTGVGPRDRSRLETARHFGADATVDVSSADPAEEILAATGRLADVVVDVTSKAPSAFTQSLGLARPGGTVVTAGTRGTALLDAFSPDLIVFKELNVLGALGVDTESYRRAIEILAGDRWPFAAIDRRVASLDEAEDLIRAMAAETDEDPPMHGVVSP